MNRKPVMLDEETHARLKKMADDAGVSGITMGTIITNLLNMVENRVNDAKE